jgi:hypothetical protein
LIVEACALDGGLHHDLKRGVSTRIEGCIGWVQHEVGEEFNATEEFHHIAQRYNVFLR